MFSTKKFNSIDWQEKYQITVLDVSNQGLQGKLDLQAFTNLQVLICSHNELTEIIFYENNLTNLVRFDCSYNQIKKIEIQNSGNVASISNLEKFIANDNVSIDLEFLNKIKPEKLLYLDVRNSSCSYLYHNYNHYNYNYNENYSTQQRSFDLSDFSKFTNLEVLMLGNDKEQNIQRCKGSFISIRELANLKRLSARNSDVSDDLAYLSESLKTENFDYKGCSKIEEQLEPFKGQSDPLKAWREKQTYYKLYQEIREKEIYPLQQKLNQEENNLKSEQEKSANLQQQLENKQKEFESKQKELEKCQTNLSYYQKFVDNHLGNKRTELELLTKKSKASLGENQEWLDSFFKAQKEISRNSNNSFAQEQSENARSILNKKLAEEELQNLLDRCKDIWQLEKQLMDLNIYEDKQAQIQVLPK